MSICTQFRHPFLFRLEIIIKYFTYFFADYMELNIEIISLHP
jgi:hypothetical protein